MDSRYKVNSEEEETKSFLISGGRGIREQNKSERERERMKKREREGEFAGGVLEMQNS